MDAYNCSSKNKQYMIKSLFLFITILCFSFQLKADSFCAVVLAANGLNVRTTAAFDSPVLYKLNEGSTFKFYSDAYTSAIQTVKDGNKELKGYWLEIESYVYNDSLKSDEAYVFMSQEYATELYDCDGHRHRVLESELYASQYASQEEIKNFKALFSIEHFDGKLSPNISHKLVANNEDYTELHDTLLLHLDGNKQKAIVSYPMGKNGYDEEMEIHTYVAYSSLLNAYLIETSLWEHSSYFFVDKSSGDKSLVFSGRPKISSGGQFFISCNDDYGGGLEFSIHKIANGSVQEMAYYGFNGWAYDNEFFWIGPNTFLVAVRSKKDEDNWIDENYVDHEKAKALRRKIRKQYLKFTIL